MWIGIGVIVFLVGLSGPVSAGEPGRAEGIWRTESPDPEAGGFGELFIQIGGGPAPGLAHTVDAGYLRFSSVIEEVRFDDPKLRLRFEGSDIRYEGRMQEEGGRIEGEMIYPGGRKLPLHLVAIGEEKADHFRARPVADEDEAAFAWRRPDAAADGWVVASPEEVGIDRGVLERFVRSLASGEYGQVHSVLAARRGRLFLEEYFYGYTRAVPHPLQSVTKSITALLVGIAVDRGGIESVDVAVPRFFPDYEPILAEGWEKIRLRHLLSMTAGLAWDDESTRRFEGADDFFEPVLSRPVAAEPGTRFSYDSPNVNLLAGVIDHSTGMDAASFAETHLFAPLGITGSDWNWGRRGVHPRCDGSLALPPRAMAKIGQLVLDNGLWNGARIVSATWIEEMTDDHADPDGPESYGYLWWKATREVGGRTLNGVFANGMGSQFIFVFPELEMVVVRTGGNQYNGMHFAPAGAVTEFLLPAVR